MFKPVSSKVNFPEMEEKLLRFWQEKKIFQRSVDQRRDGPRFTLYEGPPTANGNPGIHHVLARVFKDVIPRYKAMKGYYAPRIAGWDTHGLPVELEVEKQLNLKSKKEIEEYGIARFNAMCRESVFRYLKEWNTLTERIAFWVDLEHPYVTMDNNFIETGWWTIKQLWDKGLVYQGYKVAPHCPRCGTSLSSHEVALGYKDDVPDPSVYIKFKVDLASLQGSEIMQRFHKLFSASDKPAFLLAWTTTPWTLPGNTALAVSAEADYSVVETESEYLILAEARREAVGLDAIKVIDRIKGGDLAGLYYEHLYNIPVAYSKRDAKRGYRVIKGDFVSMDDGTGIVHIAPAYGEIDFEVGEREGLPLIHSVDLRGFVKKFPTGFTPKYREEVLAGSVIPIFGPADLPITPGAGRFVKDADRDIIADLKSRNLLFHSETIRHTYPFCWRCGTPLLYYAKETWYIRTTAVKDKLIAGNEEINWYPEHIKHGRFGDWLQNNVDWAFSRERYWGTPLPVWQCESCDAYECIGSMAELKKKPGFAGLREPLDLHRPYIDEVTFACGKCGGNMERVPEVIDCWFDSGNMPIAQYHYPFDSDSKTMFEDGRFPADYICEAVDQTRGWFYSLHAISTLLFGRISYKNVICLGLILDAKGEKMSKAKGNVVQPWMIINKYGADALRWYCLTGAPPGNVRRFDEKMVSEITRQFFLTLWNVYSFFVTYANIDKFMPKSVAIAGKPTPFGTVRGGQAQSELDRWLVSELNQLILDVDAALAGYDPTEAGRKIEEFVDELSNWYVRRSRRRFWKSENDADKLSAYTTLYECLVTLAKLLAPLVPYLAEELYLNLIRSVSSGAPESVHLADFPAADKSKIDQQLSEDIRLAMRVCSLGRAARSQAGIKVRQPLAKVVVKVGAERQREAFLRMKPQILDELNAKDLEFVDSDYFLRLQADKFSTITEWDYGVSVPKEISSDLKAEGMAREIVHRIQTMRRSAGFEIADYIVTYYQGDAYDAYIKQAVLTQFADYIKQETLSRELVEGIPEQGVSTERFKLEGHEIVLGVKKLD